MKNYIVWYVNLQGQNDWQAHAKINQLSDFIYRRKPFGDSEVIIIPAREDKFCLLETEEEVKKKFKSLDEFYEYIGNIESKLKECFSKSISI